MLTKVLITSICVEELVSRLLTVLSSLKMMVLLYQPSSKVSNELWLVNTAGNYRPRYLLGNADSLSSVFVKVGLLDMGCVEY